MLSADAEILFSIESVSSGEVHPALFVDAEELDRKTSRIKTTINI
jgi:hypothetical protein